MPFGCLSACFGSSTAAKQEGPRGLEAGDAHTCEKPPGSAVPVRLRASQSGRRSSATEVLPAADSATGYALLPTRRTASVKACLRIEHYSFIKDVGTNNYYEAITPTAASRLSPRVSQRLSRNGAATPPAPAPIDATDLSQDSDVLLCVSPELPAGMRRPKWSSEDYVVLDQIHQGHSSTVFKASRGRGGERVPKSVVELVVGHEMCGTMRER